MYDKKTDDRVINVIIPTLSRERSCIRTVGSVLRSSYRAVHVTVVVDGGDREYFGRIRHALRSKENVSTLFNPSRFGWCRSLNRVLKETDYPLYFYGGDDLVVHRQCLERGIRCLDRYFPDGDAVVGINQKDRGIFCPAAFGIFGKKWKERYPDNQVFFPNYRHYCGDAELWCFAQSAGKFILCEEAQTAHGFARDACNKLAGSTFAKDRELWFQKKEFPEKYWGRSFKLEPPF